MRLLNARDGVSLMKTVLSGGLRLRKIPPLFRRCGKIAIPKRLKPRAWPTPSASGTALKLRIIPSAISPVGPQIRRPRS